MTDIVSQAPHPGTLEAAWQVIDELWAMILPLRAENQTLKEQIQQLSQQLEHLEERLKLNSSNSSKPPSTDPPKKNKSATPSNKPRGGQPGHKGHFRDLVPPEDVKETIPCYPVCPLGAEFQLRPDPTRHQVFELPEIKPDVYEYQIYRGFCTRCGEFHTGKLPAGVPTGMLGPRALGLQGLLASHYHLSKEKIQALFGEIFGLKVSTGALSENENLLSEALKPVYEEACAALSQQPVVNMDETGSRQGNSDGNNPQHKKAWAWVAVCAHLTVFRLSLSRGQAVVKSLLGESFTGIIGCDRWSAYNVVAPQQRAHCWSHLFREFQRMAQRPGESGEIGQALFANGQAVFKARHEGTLPERLPPLRQKMKDLLERGASYSFAKKDTTPRAKTARTCRSLLKVEEAYWTFAHTQGVEPTNNAAERAIRPWVVWRKVCYGTQSERGSRLMERVFTVVATCRQQGRNLLKTLAQAIEAHLGLGSRPSLLPEAQLVSFPQPVLSSTA